MIYQDLSANRGLSDRQPEVPGKALVMQQDMNKHMMTTSRFASSALMLAAGALLALPALAQNYPITAGQKATA